MTEHLAHKEFAISSKDSELVESIAKKIQNIREQYEKLSVISEPELSSFLSSPEIALIKRVYDIDPQLYGFKGNKVGIEPVPQKLVRVEPQPYHFEGQALLTNVQYLPEPTYVAFTKMSDAAKTALDRPLLIVSSYRSHTFQAMLFLAYLKQYDYDVSKTTKRVAVPGYSEHTTPSSLALDLANIDGLPSDEDPHDFETTDEYRWLQQYAVNFDFYESYPKDNDMGVMFEPWHWRHIPKTADTEE